MHCLAAFGLYLLFREGLIGGAKKTVGAARRHCEGLGITPVWKRGIQKETTRLNQMSVYRGCIREGLSFSFPFVDTQRAYFFISNKKY